MKKDLPDNAGVDSSEVGQIYLSFSTAKRHTLYQLMPCMYNALATHFMSHLLKTRVITRRDGRAPARQGRKRLPVWRWGQTSGVRF
jgi:hypothetical protein